MGKTPDAKSRQRSIRDSSLRGPRLEALFREELCSLFDTEINDSHLSSVTVTRVELTRDGACARVWFQSKNTDVTDENVEFALQRARGFLRSRLSEALPLKRTPELRFYRDPTPSEPFLSYENP
jgi:ribosome-binding factor A